MSDFNLCSIQMVQDDHWYAIDITQWQHHSGFALGLISYQDISRHIPLPYFLHWVSRRPIFLAWHWWFIRRRFNLCTCIMSCIGQGGRISWLLMTLPKHMQHTLTRSLKPSWVLCCKIGGKKAIFHGVFLTTYTKLPYRMQPWLLSNIVMHVLTSKNCNVFVTKMRSYLSSSWRIDLHAICTLLI